MCAIQNADIYMFDEPSSYLDVRQRLQAAKVIRNLVQDTKLVFYLFLNLKSNFIELLIYY